MKITSQQPPEFQSVKGGSAKENQKSKDISGKLGSTEPPVKMSTFAMKKIKSQISNEPEVRLDRVAEIKDRIKSGEYKVDSQRLAKVMLEDAFEEDLS